MKNRFIDRFDVILLDMGNTFMFDVDRFSNTEDFGATYRHLGGKLLTSEAVHHIISTVFTRMLIDYENPDYSDCFPSVLSYLKTMVLNKDIPESEIIFLEQVFAVHEVGVIPETYVDCLYQLRKTHRLGIVSNIWSRSDLYLQEFERVGIRHLFNIIIFSSEHGCIKPSIHLFNKALEAFAVDLSKIVFVGDSLKFDIAGAQAAGLATVWINRGVKQFEVNASNPNLVIENLPNLLKR